MRPAFCDERRRRFRTNNGEPHIETLPNQRQDVESEPSDGVSVWRMKKAPYEYQPLPFIEVRLRFRGKVVNVWQERYAGGRMPAKDLTRFILCNGNIHVRRFNQCR